MALAAKVDRLTRVSAQAGRFRMTAQIQQAADLPMDAGITAGSTRMTPA